MLRRRMCLAKESFPTPFALLPRETATSHPRPKPLQGPPFSFFSRPPPGTGTADLTP